MAVSAFMVHRKRMIILLPEKKKSAVENEILSRHLTVLIHSSIFASFIISLLCQGHVGTEKIEKLVWRCHGKEKDQRKVRLYVERPLERNIQLFASVSGNQLATLYQHPFR